MELPKKKRSKNHVLDRTTDNRQQKKSYLTCSICKETLSNSTYVSHMLIHKIKIYQCENCGDTFKHPQSYYRHKKEYPDNHCFPCKKCGRVFKRVHFLRKHFCKNVNCEDSLDEINKSVDSMVTKFAVDESKKVFRCEICEWVFTTSCSLKRHLKVYKSTHFIFPCCGEVCRRSSVLKHVCDNEIKENLQSVDIFDNDYVDDVGYKSTDTEASDVSQETGDNDRKFRCDNCPATYFRLSTLKHHIKKYPNKHDFVCSKCKKHFLEETQLEKHTCILASNKKFQCSCEKYFKNVFEFKKHIGRSRPFTCCACNKQSQSLTNLINHIRTHTLEKPFFCNFCNKGFSVKESLVVHKRLHLKLRPHKCNLCNYTTTTKWNLKLHLRKHISDNEKVRDFLCTQCGASFLLKQHLRRHVQSHSEKKNLCLLCGKLFSHSEYLKKHMLKHRSEAGQNCSKCEQIIPKNEMYKHHLQTKHYEFVCDPCKKVFRAKYNLDRHLKSHDKLKSKPDESIFVCHVCKRTFSCKQSWSKHYYRHASDAGEEKFYCKFCSRVFTRAGNLNRHVLLTHKGVEGEHNAGSSLTTKN